MQVLKEEVRERILAAAVQVFYEKDFRSAKLQDIARLADVSVSLLYSYFKNKEKLF
ncbi:MAG: helix-turn-helix transcriptional regulator, partial [Atopobium sp.]|nr:helix-turn-helix transcriptional regulator [Atopobium sp.]